MHKSANWLIVELKAVTKTIAKIGINNIIIIIMAVMYLH